MLTDESIQHLLGCRTAHMGVSWVAPSQSKVVEAELDSRTASVLEANLVHPGQVTVELGDGDGQLGQPIAGGTLC